MTANAVDNQIEGMNNTNMGTSFLHNFSIYSVIFVGRKIKLGEAPEKSRLTHFSTIRGSDLFVRNFV